VPEDFRLAPAGAPVDGGYAFASAEQVWTDFASHCRPADGDGDGAADFDVGAFEYGTDASCVAAPEPAASAGALAAFSVGLVFNGWMLLLNRAFYGLPLKAHRGAGYRRTVGR